MHIKTPLLSDLAPNTFPKQASFLDEHGSLVHLPYSLTCSFLRWLHPRAKAVVWLKAYDFADVYTATSSGQPKQYRCAAFHVVRPLASPCVVAQVEVIRLALTCMLGLAYKLELGNLRVRDFALHKAGVVDTTKVLAVLATSEQLFFAKWSAMRTHLLQEAGLTSKQAEILRPFLMKGDLDSKAFVEKLLRLGDLSEGAQLGLEASLRLLERVQEADFHPFFGPPKGSTASMYFRVVVKRQMKGHHNKHIVVTDNSFKQTHPKGQETLVLMAEGGQHTLESSVQVTSVRFWVGRMEHCLSVPPPKNILVTSSCTTSSEEEVFEEEDRLDLCSFLWEHGFQADYQHPPALSLESMAELCVHTGVSFRVFQTSPGVFKVKGYNEQAHVSQNKLSKEDLVVYLKPLCGC